MQIAVNDNNALFSPPRRVRAVHVKGAAYGRAALIIALLAVVAGIIALPLLQGLAVPIMTAGEERPRVLRGSPIAPTLLQPQGMVEQAVLSLTPRKKPRRDWSERGSSLRRPGARRAQGLWNASATGQLPEPGNIALQCRSTVALRHDRGGAHG